MASHTIHARYFPKDTEPQTALSSFTVLRAVDNESFLATVFPDTKTLDAVQKDLYEESSNTALAPLLIPFAATPISRILNHPNIVSLVDIVQAGEVYGSHVAAPVEQNGEVKVPSNFTVWEDMNAGSLAYLLPTLTAFPQDNVGKHTLASQDYNRISLPESLCWHVLLSISKALLWLHHGVKETEDIREDWLKHDEDWQPILIRDVSPDQIWFKHPKADETYGECKLSGFQWAKVTGCPGGGIATADRVEIARAEKRHYWAPEVWTNTLSHSRASEIWSLGAVIYTMMTGMPPIRLYDYNWQVSRMNDKGFSPGLRKIVGMMLLPDIHRRYDALVLVDEVREGMRFWRTSTVEGQQYVDVQDEAHRRMYENALRAGPPRRLI